MKILVTGANGYIGQGVVKAILDSGNEVIATDFSTQYVDERANLAWIDSFVHTSPFHIQDLPSHYAFLKKMVDEGIGRVCVMGSMHEIGFFEGSIHEDTPCHPMNLYGISKNALRNCVELMTTNTKTKWQWLRGYYIVGNSEFGDSIFSKITKAEHEGKKEFPFTMGQNQYDFIDFCMQVASVVGQDEVNGIINIGSGRPEKLADRVERFIKENNYHIQLKYGAFPDRPYDSKAVWGDGSKIAKIMGK